jgi:hypothetical protein
MIAQQTITRSFSWIWSQWKHSRNAVSVNVKHYTSLTFSIVVLSALFGSSIVKLLFLNLIGYILSQSFAGKSYFPLMIWTYCISLLFLNHYYDGYSTGIFSSLAWLDSLKGIGMKWMASFNFSVLRMISFGMDLHWKRTTSKKISVL